MIAFLVVGAAALAAAIGVITARSAVHSVLWLIVHLCSLAVLYMTLRAQFLGLVQILIYAGAVMVLFLFVIGLLSAQQGGAPVPRAQLPRQVGFAIFAAVVVAGAVILAALFGAFQAAAPSLPAGFGGVTAFGTVLFSTYLLPFEATAMALLTAIVAVVALGAGHDEPARPAGLPVREAEPEAHASIDVSHAEHRSELAARGGQR